MVNSISLSFGFRSLEVGFLATTDAAGVNLDRHNLFSKQKPSMTTRDKQTRSSPSPRTQFSTSTIPLTRTGRSSDSTENSASRLRTTSRLTMRYLHLRPRGRALRRSPNTKPSPSSCPPRIRPQARVLAQRPRSRAYWLRRPERRRPRQPHPYRPHPYRHSHKGP